MRMRMHNQKRGCSLEELELMALFKRRSFCVVTGASRGLGREIAVQLSKEWSLAGCFASQLSSE